MIKLNEELSEFVGAFIGDGCFGKYGKNQFRIEFVGHKILDKEYLINYLVPLIKRNFLYVNPRIYYRSDENTIRIVFYSKELFNFLRMLGFKPGVKSRTVVIPKIIMSNAYLTNFTIRGIFDTDGCVFFDKRKKYKTPYPRIVLQSASINLIKQLENHLSKEFSLYVNTSNRDGYRNNIEIYGHNQLEKFLKLIGFSNQRHLSKIAPVA